MFPEDGVPHQQKQVPEEKIVVTSRRPNRQTIISLDDILNLVILLNTTISVTEFLNKLEN